MRAASAISRKLPSRSRLRLLIWILAIFSLTTATAFPEPFTMMPLYRHNGEWKFKALGEWGEGRTFDRLLPNILPHI